MTQKDGLLSPDAQETLPSPGNRITDCETGDELVILGTPGTTANETVIWEMPAGEPDKTVAESNTQAVGDELVIDAVYLNSIEKRDSTVKEILRNYESATGKTGEVTGGIDITVYSFPLSRLEID